MDLVQDISTKEVSRYLGYGKNEVDKSTLGIINDCIAQMKQIATPRHIFKIFDISKCEDGVQVQDTPLILKGNNIANHLKNSNKVAVMACTLGVEVDRQIRFLEHSDLARALVFNATAVEYIEKVCDAVQNLIKCEALNFGFSITNRYSPGYGDMSIDHQPKIIQLLGCEKAIGLTATQSFILLPSKSVTAFIGLEQGAHTHNPSGCADCSKCEQCDFAK